jgi:hypothetical protein
MMFCAFRIGASERISWLGLARSEGSVVSRQRIEQVRCAALACGSGAIAGPARRTGGPASGRFSSAQVALTANKSLAV